MSKRLPLNHPSNRRIKSGAPRGPSSAGGVIRHASDVMVMCVENEDRDGWMREFFERDLRHPSWPNDVDRVCNYIPTSSFREWEISTFVEGVGELLDYFYEFCGRPYFKVLIDCAMAPHDEDASHVNHRSFRTQDPVENALYIMVKMVSGGGASSVALDRTQGDITSMLFGVLFEIVRPLCLRAEMEGENDLRVTLSETPGSPPMVTARIGAEDFLDEDAVGQLIAIQESVVDAGGLMREVEFAKSKIKERAYELDPSAGDRSALRPILDRINRFAKEALDADEAGACAEAISDFIDSCVKKQD